MLLDIVVLLLKIDQPNKLHYKFGNKYLLWTVALALELVITEAEDATAAAATLKINILKSKPHRVDK